MTNVSTTAEMYMPRAHDHYAKEEERVNSLQRPYNGRNIYPVLNIATSAWWALIETQQPGGSKVPRSGFRERSSMLLQVSSFSL